MKKAIVPIVTLALLFATAACQTGLEPGRLQQYNNGDGYEQYKEDYDIMDKGPVSGGTINLFSTEPDSLNPLLTNNTYTADFLGFVYEGMVRLDENQIAAGVLCDEWSVSQDGLVWNFHIKDGIKWHDGQQFTANDVEFTIQTIMNPAIDSVYKPLLGNVATCAAVDSSTIKIALNKPNSFMPEMMTFPIIPRHQFKQQDVLSVSKNFQPVGTGAYRFVSYDQGRNVMLKSNEQWHGLSDDGSEASGTMYIENINVNIFKNPDDAMGAFQTGEVDVAGIGAGDFSKYKGRTDLIIKKYTSRDFEFLALNLKNPLFTDIFARKAISMAIDRERLINDVLLGDAEAAEMPVLPDSWMSDIEGLSVGTAASASADLPAISAASDLADSALNSADTPEEVLVAGGWKQSSQGYYKTISGMRRYLKAELLVNSNNSIRVRAAQKICEQLVKAGIPAEVKQLDWNEMMKRVNASKYDIAFIGCRIPQIPDISYLYSADYLSGVTAGIPGAAHNVSGYINMQADDKIGEFFKENDPERRKMLYRSLKETVQNDVPYIGLYFLRDAMVYSKNIRGPLEPDTWNRYYDISRWYKPELP